MATDQAPATSTMDLLRFDPVQRATHWITALLFAVLVATAIPLYFGSFFGVVLPRFRVEQVHLWSGIALPVPLVVSLLGPWGQRMRRDARRVNYWARDEIAWLKSLGRAPLDADKFNPGQKLNAALVASSMAVMLASGVVLKWFSYFPVSWRGGSTFVHDVGAWLMVALIGGHVVMGLTHREALSSMLTGRISERWAQTHASRWLRDEREDSPVERE
ncbi:MAG: cytochrome b/b6 domain-containing protein [Actinomycetales bacterium]|nr:cytochrome b/b6 domain-containing protein [Actinomycetales bacterium]